MKEVTNFLISEEEVKQKTVDPRRKKSFDNPLQLKQEKERLINSDVLSLESTLQDFIDILLTQPIWGIAAQLKKASEPLTTEDVKVLKDLCKDFLAALTKLNNCLPESQKESKEEETDPLLNNSAVHLQNSQRIEAFENAKQTLNMGIKSELERFSPEKKSIAKNLFRFTQAISAYLDAFQNSFSPAEKRTFPWISKECKRFDSVVVKTLEASLIQSDLLPPPPKKLLNTGFIENEKKAIALGDGNCLFNAIVLNILASILKVPSDQRNAYVQEHFSQFLNLLFNKQTLQNLINNYLSKFTGPYERNKPVWANELSNLLADDPLQNLKTFLEKVKVLGEQQNILAPGLRKIAMDESFANPQDITEKTDFNTAFRTYCFNRLNKKNPSLGYGENNRIFFSLFEKEFAELFQTRKIQEEYQRYQHNVDNYISATEHLVLEDLNTAFKSFCISKIRGDSRNVEGYNINYFNNAFGREFENFWKELKSYSGWDNRQPNEHQLDAILQTIGIAQRLKDLWKNSKAQYKTAYLQREFDNFIYRGRDLEKQDEVWLKCVPVYERIMRNNTTHACADPHGVKLLKKLGLNFIVIDTSTHHRNECLVGLENRPTVVVAFNGTNHFDAVLNKEIAEKIQHDQTEIDYNRQQYAAKQNTLRQNKTKSTLAIPNFSNDEVFAKEYANLAIKIDDLNLAKALRESKKLATSASAPTVPNSLKSSSLKGTLKRTLSARTQTKLPKENQEIILQKLTRISTYLGIIEHTIHIAYEEKDLEKANNYKKRIDQRYMKEIEDTFETIRTMLSYQVSNKELLAQLRKTCPEEKSVIEEIEKSYNQVIIDINTLEQHIQSQQSPSVKSKQYDAMPSLSIRKLNLKKTTLDIIRANAEVYLSSPPMPTRAALNGYIPSSPKQSADDQSLTDGPAEDLNISSRTIKVNSHKLTFDIAAVLNNDPEILMHLKNEIALKQQSINAEINGCFLEISEAPFEASQFKTNRYVLTYDKPESQSRFKLFYIASNGKAEEIVIKDIVPLDFELAAFAQKLPGSADVKKSLKEKSRLTLQQIISTYHSHHPKDSGKIDNLAEAKKFLQKCKIMQALIQITLDTRRKIGVLKTFYRPPVKPFLGKPKAPISEMHILLAKVNEIKKLLENHDNNIARELTEHCEFINNFLREYGRDHVITPDKLNPDNFEKTISEIKHCFDQDQRYEFLKASIELLQYLEVSSIYIKDLAIEWQNHVRDGNVNLDPRVFLVPMLELIQETELLKNGLSVLSSPILENSKKLTKEVKRRYENIVGTAEDIYKLNTARNYVEILEAELKPIQEWKKIIEELKTKLEKVEEKEIKHVSAEAIEKVRKQAELVFKAAESRKNFFEGYFAYLKKKYPEEEFEQIMQGKTHAFGKSAPVDVSVYERAEVSSTSLDKSVAQDLTNAVPKSIPREKFPAYIRGIYFRAAQHAQTCSDIMKAAAKKMDRCDRYLIENMNRNTAVQIENLNNCSMQVPAINQLLQAVHEKIKQLNHLNDLISLKEGELPKTIDTINTLLAQLSNASQLYEAAKNHPEAIETHKELQDFIDVYKSYFSFGLGEVLQELEAIQTQEELNIFIQTYENHTSFGRREICQRLRTIEIAQLPEFLAAYKSHVAFGLPGLIRRLTTTKECLESIKTNIQAIEQYATEKDSNTLTAELVDQQIQDYVVALKGSNDNKFLIIKTSLEIIHTGNTLKNNFTHLNDSLASEIKNFPAPQVKPEGAPWNENKYIDDPQYIEQRNNFLTDNLDRTISQNKWTLIKELAIIDDSELHIKKAHEILTKYWDDNGLIAKISTQLNKKIPIASQFGQLSEIDKQEIERLLNQFKHALESDEYKSAFNLISHYQNKSNLCQRWYQLLTVSNDQGEGLHTLHQNQIEKFEHLCQFLKSKSNEEQLNDAIQQMDDLWKRVYETYDELDQQLDDVAKPDTIVELSAIQITLQKLEAFQTELTSGEYKNNLYLIQSNADPNTKNLAYDRTVKITKEEEIYKTALAAYKAKVTELIESAEQKSQDKIIEVAAKEKATSAKQEELEEAINDANLEIKAENWINKKDKILLSQDKNALYEKVNTSSSTIWKTAGLIGLASGVGVFSIITAATSGFGAPLAIVSGAGTGVLTFLGALGAGYGYRWIKQKSSNKGKAQVTDVSELINSFVNEIIQMLKPENGKENPRKPEAWIILSLLQESEKIHFDNPDRDILWSIGPEFVASVIDKWHNTITPEEQPEFQNLKDFIINFSLSGGENHSEKPQYDRLAGNLDHFVEYAKNNEYWLAVEFLRDIYNAEPKNAVREALQAMKPENRERLLLFIFSDKYQPQLFERNLLNSDFLRAIEEAFYDLVNVETLMEEIIKEYEKGYLQKVKPPYVENSLEEVQQKITRIISGFFNADHPEKIAQCLEYLIKHPPKTDKKNKDHTLTTEIAVEFLERIHQRPTNAAQSVIKEVDPQIVGRYISLLTIPTVQADNKASYIQTCKNLKDLSAKPIINQVQEFYENIQDADITQNQKLQIEKISNDTVFQLDSNDLKKIAVRLGYLASIYNFEESTNENNAIEALIFAILKTVYDRISIYRARGQQADLRDVLSLLDDTSLHKLALILPQKSSDTLEDQENLRNILTLIEFTPPNLEVLNFTDDDVAYIDEKVKRYNDQEAVLEPSELVTTRLFHFVFNSSSVEIAAAFDDLLGTAQNNATEAAAFALLKVLNYYKLANRRDLLPEVISIIKQNTVENLSKLISRPSLRDSIASSNPNLASTLAGRINAAFVPKASPAICHRYALEMLTSTQEKPMSFENISTHQVILSELWKQSDNNKEIFSQKLLHLLEVLKINAETEIKFYDTILYEIITCIQSDKNKILNAITVETINTVEKFQRENAGQYWSSSVFYYNIHKPENLDLAENFDAIYRKTPAGKIFLLKDKEENNSKNIYTALKQILPTDFRPEISVSIFHQLFLAATNPEDPDSAGDAKTIFVRLMYHLARTQDEFSLKVRFSIISGYLNYLNNSNKFEIARQEVTRKVVVTWLDDLYAQAKKSKGFDPKLAALYVASVLRKIDGDNIDETMKVQQPLPSMLFLKEQSTLASGHLLLWMSALNRIQPPKYEAGKIDSQWVSFATLNAYEYVDILLLNQSDLGKKLKCNWLEAIYDASRNTPNPDEDLTARIRAWVERINKAAAEPKFKAVSEICEQQIFLLAQPPEAKRKIYGKLITALFNGFAGLAKQTNIYDLDMHEYKYSFEMYMRLKNALELNSINTSVLDQAFNETDAGILFNLDNPKYSDVGRILQHKYRELKNIANEDKPNHTKFKEWIEGLFNCYPVVHNQEKKPTLDITLKLAQRFIDGLLANRSDITELALLDVIKTTLDYLKKHTLTEDPLEEVKKIIINLKGKYKAIPALEEIIASSYKLADELHKDTGTLQILKDHLQKITSLPNRLRFLASDENKILKQIPKTELNKLRKTTIVSIENNDPATIGDVLFGESTSRQTFFNRQRNLSGVKTCITALLNDPVFDHTDHRFQDQDRQKKIKDTMHDMLKAYLTPSVANSKLSESQRELENTAFYTIHDWANANDEKSMQFTPFAIQCFNTVFASIQANKGYSHLQQKFAKDTSKLIPERKTSFKSQTIGASNADNVPESEIDVRRFSDASEVDGASENADDDTQSLLDP